MMTATTGKSVVSADVGGVIEAIHHPAFVVDGDGRILALNGKASLMSLRGREGSLGAPCTEAFDCLPRGFRPSEGSDGCCGTRVTRTRITLTDGQPAWVVTLVEGSAENVTSEFVAISAHELRTPMTTIKALASLLMAGRYGGITPEQAKALSTMNRSVDRLVSFANDLITLSRIDGGMMSLAVEQYDPLGVISDEVAKREPRLSARSIAALVSGEGLNVYGDREKYRQVLGHILDNAVRYAPDGTGIPIRVGADGQSFVTSVGNSGGAIPSEKLPFIFDKFYQCNGVDSALHAGRGLGLSICKGLVGLMGGSIRVDNHDDGKGVTFSFTIPMK